MLSEREVEMRLQRKMDRIARFGQQRIRQLRPKRTRWEVARLLVRRSRKVASGCREFIGCLDDCGYGKFNLGPESLAHRVSYVVFVGPIPDGLNVCHTCDNPRCIRPSHFFLGTQQDNIIDCARKNRLERAFGEHVNTAKLTDQIVLGLRSEIRSCENGHQRRRTVQEYARLFGVSESAARYAASGRSWKHLTNSA